jgi:hypothetical protein
LKNLSSVPVSQPFLPSLTCAVSLAPYAFLLLGCIWFIGFLTAQPSAMRLSLIPASCISYIPLAFSLFFMSPLAFRLSPFAYYLFCLLPVTCLFIYL